MRPAQRPPGGKKLKKKLKLNVGGRIFKDVLRETLCYVEGSHLAELFSGRREGKLLRDSSGKIKSNVSTPLGGETHFGPGAWFSAAGLRTVACRDSSPVLIALTS